MTVTKLFFSLVLVAFFILTTIASGEEKPNFSGVWKVNKEKCRLQLRIKLENLTKGEFTIKHNEPNFHFSRTFVVKGMGSNTYSYDLTTDGKEAVKKEDDSTIYSRLYWDNNALILDSRIVTKDGEATNWVRY